jgi:hypothetical protein
MSAYNWIGVLLQELKGIELFLGIMRELMQYCYNVIKIIKIVNY